MSRFTSTAAVAALVMLGFTACDGDDGFDVAAFCDIAEEISATDDFPSEDQMDRYVEEAPEEIRDDAEFAREQILGAEGSPEELFSDPEFEEATGSLEDAEAEHCDLGDDGAAGDVTPEFAEYCELINELDESDELPTAEQVDAVKEAAPEEIADEVNTFADAFVASEGNIGVLIADPEAQAASQVMEPFEAEHCGEAQAEADVIATEGDEEAAEGATVIEADAVEYAFEGVPDEVEAGQIALSVTNAGEEGHEMFVAKLAEGTDIDEVLAFEGDPFEAGLVTDEVGSVFLPSPGDTRFINGEVDAGTYGYVCFIPGAEGTPHAMLGMAGQFTVT